MATSLPNHHPLVNGQTTAAPLIEALRGRRPSQLPVWFMRQAGRSLPEYRQARQGTTMLEACLEPTLAAELTLQPVRRHDVDAAIFFSDIVVPLKLAGVGVEIKPGVGPVMDQPYRTARDIARLTEQSLTAAALAPIFEAVTQVVAELSPNGRPLIGFGGAPFTVAAYLVEGGPSRDHLAARRLMHTDPASWRRLLDWTADLTAQFLVTQVVAGASAVQLFDSWAGSLSQTDYHLAVAPASARALAPVAQLRPAGVTPDAGGPGRSVSTPDPVKTSEVAVPVIHFAVGAGHLLTALHQVEVEAGVVYPTVGVDYRMPLDQAIAQLGPGVAVQGNIDPARLDTPWPLLEAHVRDVVRRGGALAAGQPVGHVVNLGHGVPPDTDPEVLTRLTALVHQLEAAGDPALEAAS
ncbi:MAG: uroporphyrinogen decarboxylase [Propionibacteriaceae bacterium]|jgi:uroporphyrinogen decarboxylase|nr:uroporphyrinogen decarboxylase [Propionibacteriaceae bacterium]